jgi:hypothetical protein
VLAADSPTAADIGHDRLETLRRLGILLDVEAFDAHAERVAAALGLLAHQCLQEAAIDLRGARRAAPVLTTTWLVEAFTLLRRGAIRAGRALLEQYCARWPDDPAARALLAAHDHGSLIGAQHGRVMVLAPSAKLARELALRADACVKRIRALCGHPPNPTLLVSVTDSVDAGGRCLRGGSPFARLIELSRDGADDSLLLAHELVHATLSSGNLAFTEGLALHVSATLGAPGNDTFLGGHEWLAREGNTSVELESLFLDIDAQVDAFDRTRQELSRAPGMMPRAPWLAFLGTTALVARFGLAPLVDYLRWLRDPTPATALATQERLFQLHFGSPLRSALRPMGASQLAS